MSFFYRAPVLPTSRRDEIEAMSGVPDFEMNPKVNDYPEAVPIYNKLLAKARFIEDYLQIRYFCSSGRRLVEFLRIGPSGTLRK